MSDTFDNDNRDRTTALQAVLDAWNPSLHRYAPFVARKATTTQYSISDIQRLVSIVRCVAQRQHEFADAVDVIFDHDDERDRTGAMQAMLDAWRELLECYASDLASKTAAQFSVSDTQQLVSIVRRLGQRQHEFADTLELIADRARKCGCPVDGEIGKYTPEIFDVFNKFIDEWMDLNEWPLWGYFPAPRRVP